MSSIPSLGNSVEAVMDAFRRLDREWAGGLGTVEARDLFGLRYRWCSDASGAGLGVSMDDGWTIREATDQEYHALEQALARGAVEITLFNRVTRQTRVVHQATGMPMPMEEPDHSNATRPAGLEPRLFTAYKTYTVDGNQRRGCFIHALSLEEVQDPARFPLEPQRDEQGSFVWAFEIYRGEKS